MYKLFIKRLLDIILSAIAIVALAIPMLIIAVAIKIDSPGPVFFKQRRVGIHKKEFIMLKFRSMPVTAPNDVATHQLDIGAIQMTKFQKVIRKYSIDELPQVYNIFAGQLSLIGPRPALYNQYDLVAERERYGANDVKPGLSGWAQINGRDELPISVKAKLDGEYVQRMSFGFDCKCFFGTFACVAKHRGFVEGGMSEAENKEAEKQDQEV